MNKSPLAALNDAERLLVAETETAALALLDEDAVGELHGRVRRARNKYSGQYRRGASAWGTKVGARGQARPKNTAAGRARRTVTAAKGVRKQAKRDSR